MARLPRQNGAKAHQNWHDVDLNRVSARIDSNHRESGVSKRSYSAQARRARRQYLDHAFNRTDRCPTRSASTAVVRSIEAQTSAIDHRRARAERIDLWRIDCGWFSDCRSRKEESGRKVRTRVDGTRARTWCGWPRDAPQRESDRTRSTRRLAASPSGTDRDASRCGTRNGRSTRRKNGALNQSRRLVARIRDFHRNGGSRTIAAARQG